MSVFKKVLLLIHCDINKTIIVSDASSDRGFMGSLNAILSECVFGSYPLDKPMNERQAEDWIPVSSSPESVSKPGIVTFGTYLEDLTNINKPQRKALKASFAESGGIGEHYNSYLSAMKEKLKIEPTTSSASSSLACLNEGYHFILPSFIKFLRYLTSSYLTDRFDCRIIFRTFGSDIADVATELNSFCHGSHPIFPFHTISMDCYPNDFTLDISESSTASFSRFGPNEADVTLNYFNEETKHVDKITGASVCLNHVIRSLLKEENNPACRRCIAIRDDYHYWAAQNEADEAGKLLLVYSETINGYKDAELIDREVIYQV